MYMYNINYPSIENLEFVVSKDSREKKYRGYGFLLDVKNIDKEILIGLCKFVEGTTLKNKKALVFIENVSELEELFFLIRIPEKNNSLVFVANTLSEAKYIRTFFKGLIFTKEEPQDNDYFDYHLFGIDLALCKSATLKDLKELRKNGFKLMTESKYITNSFQYDYVVYKTV